MRLLILLVCLAFAAAQRKRYDGYQVLELRVGTGSQKAALDQLRNDEEMDFWTDTPVYGQPIHVMVPPHRLHDVKTLLTDVDISYYITNTNVQEQIDAEFERLKDKRDFDINDFNTFEDIEAQLQLMVGWCDSLAISCELYSIGQSIEGRELWVFRIYQGTGRTGHFGDSTIHAREWLATATTLYLLDFMILNYGTDDEVTGMLDTYDVYFLPVVNPDGYVHTWAEDRMWRKSRNINEGSNCIGTDLNRNFEYEWANAGSSDNPCSDTYHGSGPNSEPETQAVTAEAIRLGPSLASYTSIHTYGQMWMHPYGYMDGDQCAVSPDYDHQYQVAEATAQAVMATHSTVWTYGSICETIYAAAGTTIDTIYAVAGIKYSFTPELRGNGFVVPPSEIVPSFEEVWNGLKAMAAEIELIEG